MFHDLNSYRGYWPLGKMWEAWSLPGSRVFPHRQQVRWSRFLIVKDTSLHSSDFKRVRDILFVLEEGLCLGLAMLFIILPQAVQNTYFFCGYISPYWLLLAVRGIAILVSDKELNEVCFFVLEPNIRIQ
jgi:hypothetical protein